MVKDILRTEIHDMSNKIYELQEKTEHLTNGQRYAAINEIEKSMQPLRNDLRHLENQLYMQKTNDINIQKNIDEIVNQLNALENIKSDLTERINTETEHTRQELNNKIRETNWQKYEKENAELKRDKSELCNAINEEGKACVKLNEKLSKAKGFIEKLLIVSCNSEILIQYPNCKEVLEARVALEQFLMEK